jgi:translation initiation factor aIF-2/yIF-2
MSTQDAVNAFLNQLNLNAPSSTNKNKKKKKTNKKDNEQEQVEKTIQEEILESKEEKKPEKVKEVKKDKVKSTSTMAKLALQRKKQIEEEEAKLKALQEEEERKAKEEEERLEAERKRLEEIKNLKKQKEKDKIQAQKESGTYKTERQKEKERLEKLKLEQMMKAKDKPIVVKAKEQAIIQSDPYGLINPNYKSIISCILGHVDTGKTSILDKIRDTNVQKGEVGGITQQIGATFIPRETLKEKTKSFGHFPISVPGVLMIDTPGHEAFKNLRSFGSSICDIAVLVVDLVHGLEPQTIESMNLLKEANTPFIIALNKIDRLYGWKANNNDSFINTFENQADSTQDEFDTRLNKIIVQIMEQGFNTKLYWEIDEIKINRSGVFMDDFVIPICPTSAISGEGLSDLLATLIKWSQNKLTSKITLTNNLKCVLMETTKLEGFGLTLDVILIDGELKVGDKITINTISGTFDTTIKNLLTSPANRESRVKSEFIHQESINASSGVKLVVSNLENTGIPGSKIVYTDCKEELIQVETTKFELQDTGVTIFASTMGSLEALFKFLRTECKPPIPVSQVGLGKVMKKDVIKTNIINDKSLPEFKTILAFNVEIDEDAEKEAKNTKTKIFTAEIIYHLFDQYTKYKKELFTIRKEAVKDKMTFPCVLKILENCIFNKKNPLVFGVEVLKGNLHIGTHLTDPTTNTYIGKVVSIQNNHKDVEIGKKSASVCIKVDNQENPNIAYGRQFDHTNTLYSRISRESLDVLKEYYRDDCTKDDLMLIVELKKLFNIA